VLLVIFIITTPQMSNDLEMNLPSPKKEKAPAPPKINRIVVNTAGQITLNDEHVELPALKTMLFAMKKRDPETTVVIKGATDVDYQRVIGVLDLLQQADITKVGWRRRCGRNGISQKAKRIRTVEYGAERQLRPTN
jgi:biopolymer transport protein ExbD